MARKKNSNTDTAAEAQPTKEVQSAAKAQPAKETTAQKRVIDLGSRVQVQNTSHEIQIIPLGDKRKRLVPNEIWVVEDEYVELVKGFFKTPFYQAMEAKGFLRLHTSTPSKLGEVDFKSPKTPEAPEELTEKPEHVTQAEFVKEEKK